jgi:hypothetical protein
VQIRAFNPVLNGAIEQGFKPKFPTPRTETPSDDEKAVLGIKTIVNKKTAI